MPRPSVPVRSQNVPVRAAYHDYKPQLRADFSQACAYCGDSDRFYGGLPGYHVEHFAPKSLFPQLATVYANLLYACPYCNRGKSNTWVGTLADVPHDGKMGFVDPCSDEFDEHIDRDKDGNIVGLTELGEWMVKSLKLYLTRHRYIWTIRQLQACAARATVLRKRIDTSDARYLPLLELLAEINDKINEYNDSIFA